SAVDQRLGARPRDERHAGRHRRARACRRRDRDAGALQPDPQGEARPFIGPPSLRACRNDEADATEHDPDPGAGRAALPARRPLRIYGVAGHMHIRGYDIRIELNGKTLLHIPRWNFHWQDAYYLEHPVDANVGDTIRVSCKFDNSAIKQPLDNGKLLKPRYVL